MNGSCYSVHMSWDRDMSTQFEHFDSRLLISEKELQCRFIPWFMQYYFALDRCLMLSVVRTGDFCSFEYEHIGVGRVRVTRYPTRPHARVVHLLPFQFIMRNTYIYVDVRMCLKMFWVSRQPWLWELCLSSSSRVLPNTHRASRRRDYLDLEVHLPRLKHHWQ